MKISDVARIAHEVNRAYCEALGDKSQKPWEEAEDWQRESAVNGVMFHLDNPEAGPEESHRNWLSEKHANGWSYGPVKDVKNRHHPCCLPYEELPESQRAKDYIFRAIVRSCRGVR